MESTKQILTESRDAVTELLQKSDFNPLEKVQYKVMEKSLNGMLNIVIWLQNVRCLRKTR